MSELKRTGIDYEVTDKAKASDGRVWGLACLDVSEASQVIIGALNERGNNTRIPPLIPKKPTLLTRRFLSIAELEACSDIHNLVRIGILKLLTTEQALEYITPYAEAEKKTPMQALRDCQPEFICIGPRPTRKEMDAVIDESIPGFIRRT